MEARAISRYIRISSRKVNQVLKLIKYKSVEEASNILKFTPKSACNIINKTVKSAFANLKSSKSIQNVYIKSVFVDQGPTMKRIRAMAMGKRGIIRRRTSHLTVIVSDELSVKN